MKPKIFTLMLLSLMFLSCSDIGKSFENYREFIDHEKDKGYQMIGKFNDNWPAKITSEEKAMDAITFTLQNGARHNYTNYQGYELKIVRLAAADGSEGVIVFRSEEKE